MLNEIIDSGISNTLQKILADIGADTVGAPEIERPRVPDCQ